MEHRFLFHVMPWHLLLVLREITHVWLCMGITGSFSSGQADKALNGILIPATFKYADNILYSYAKPSSIVVTTLFGAAVAGVVPPFSLLLGVVLVVTSMRLYSKE